MVNHQIKRAATAPACNKKSQIVQQYMLTASQFWGPASWPKPVGGVTRTRHAKKIDVSFQNGQIPFVFRLWIQETFL